MGDRHGMARLQVNGAGGLGAGDGQAAFSQRDALERDDGGSDFLVVIGCNPIADIRCKSANHTPIMRGRVACHQSDPQIA